MSLFLRQLGLGNRVVLGDVTRVHRLRVRDRKINVTRNAPRHLLCRLLTCRVTSVLHRRARSINLSTNSRRAEEANAGLVIIVTRNNFARVVRLLFCHLALVRERPLLCSYRRLFQVRKFNRVVIYLRKRAFRSVILLHAINRRRSGRLQISNSSTLDRLVTVRLQRVSIRRCRIKLRLQRLLPYLLTVTNVDRVMTVLLRRALRRREVLRIVIYGWCLSRFFYYL